MTISDFLSQNPRIKDISETNVSSFIEIYNSAMDHIKHRMILSPMLFRCLINKGIDLNLIQSYYTEAGNGSIQFKAIIDVIGQQTVLAQPHSIINPGSISRDMTELQSGLSVHFALNILSIDTEESLVSIPVVGHPFPPAIYKVVNSNGTKVHIPYVKITETLFDGSYDRLFVPDAIVFPLSAKIYSLIAINENNIAAAGAYDSLCNNYINIRNADRINIVPRQVSLVAGIVPYDIS